LRIIVYLILSNLIKLSIDCIKFPNSTFGGNGQRLNFSVLQPPFGNFTFLLFLGFGWSHIPKNTPFGTELIYQGLTPYTQGTLATSKPPISPTFPCTSITYKIHKVPFFAKTPKITLPKKELYQLAYSYHPMPSHALSTTLFVTPFSSSRNVTHNN
jgi:hypothetical protein